MSAPAEVLRLGAIARLDPEPERTLATWRADLDRGVLDDPAETRRRLDEYEQGDAAVVELGLFADVLDGGELRRVDGLHVGGLWFERGEDVQNERHAAETVSDRIEAIRDDLERHGVPAAAAQLARLPIKIELDPELARTL
jgi:hypothetical protein